jgi:hypothetical protein
MVTNLGAFLTTSHSASGILYNLLPFLTAHNSSRLSRGTALSLPACSRRFRQGKAPDGAPTTLQLFMLSSFCGVATQTLSLKEATEPRRGRRELR